MKMTLIDTLNCEIIMAKIDTDPDFLF